MSYYQYEAGNCQHCGDPLGLIETMGGPHRLYCSSAHRQAAYRTRKAGKRNNGELRNAIERKLDQTLRLMACSCGRGIWTTQGNIQIGHLFCTMCNSQFQEIQA